MSAPVEVWSFGVTRVRQPYVVFAADHQGYGLWALLSQADSVCLHIQRWSFAACVQEFTALNRNVGLSSGPANDFSPSQKKKHIECTLSAQENNEIRVFNLIRTRFLEAIYEMKHAPWLRKHTSKIKSAIDRDTKSCSEPCVKAFSLNDVENCYYSLHIKILLGEINTCPWQSCTNKIHSRASSSTFSVVHSS